MIKVDKLNKYYKMGKQRFHALKDISLEIKDGEFVAVCGKSGAGKSTLLHILGGLDNYDEGDYLFNEINMKNLSDSRLARLRNKDIGFILQDFSLINHKSVLFNVMLPLYFSKTPYIKMKKTALEALELVGIPEQAGKKANQLSGGQRQRVAIARAIVNKPNLILADEPTGALDSQTSSQIMDLLKNMNERGMTIVVVTHDDVVSDYCGRKVVLKDGSVQSPDNP